MIIARTISRILFPLMIVFGIHIAAHGHLTPGGGFPAGVIIASAFLMIDLVYPVVSEEKRERGYHDLAPVRLNFSNFVESVSAMAIAAAIIVTLTHMSVVPELLRGDPGRLASAYSAFVLNVFGAFAVAAGMLIIIVHFLPGEKMTGAE